MKLLGVILVGLLLLIQYPLWVGHGSWLRVWELDRQLGLQQEVNAGKRMRNEGLEAEALDLRDGTQALEERARYELGMLKRDEIFVQFNPGAVPASAGGSGARGDGGAADTSGAEGGFSGAPGSPGSLILPGLAPAAPLPGLIPGGARPPGLQPARPGLQGASGPAARVLPEGVSAGGR